MQCGSVCRVAAVDWLALVMVTQWVYFEVGTELVYVLGAFRTSKWCLIRLYWTFARIKQNYWIREIDI
jgi:hypothetical protein